MVTIDHKWSRVLRALAKGRRLTRFDAERIGDHALNSTVAYLQQEKGIKVARMPVIVGGRYGDIRCCRYYLDEQQQIRARRVLELRVSTT